MPEITDQYSLEAWLETQPSEDARLIAARTALRGLPGLADLFESERVEDPYTIILSVFRAIAVASVVGKWPTQQQGIQDSAATAAANSAAAAAYFAAVAAAAAAAANSAASAAYFAASAAHSAHSAARSADSAAWNAVQSDVNLLADGDKHGDVSDLPLWHRQGPPEGLAEAWPSLRDRLLQDDPLWRVWTDWYQDRLDGKPMIEALEVEKALIPDADWNKGPTHVNAIIAGMIERYAAAATPQGEVLSVDPDDGLIELQTAVAPVGSVLENACSKVSDRLEDLRPRLDENQFTALRPVVVFLDRTVTAYADQPRRVHDDFETAVVNIQTLLDSGEASNDLDVTNLQRDLENSVLDIRADDPEIARMVDARIKARIERLSQEDRLKIADAAQAAEDVSKPDLAEQLAEDKQTLLNAPNDPAPTGGVPEGAEKTAGYRLGGRLLRIRQILADREKLRDTLGNTIGGADKLDKLMKGASWIGKGIYAIFRLLGF